MSNNENNESVDTLQVYLEKKPKYTLIPCFSGKTYVQPHQ